MDTFFIDPRVDEAREFIEIANDFSNPLEIVREAISNAFDAKATKIEVDFKTEKEYGETVFVICLRDNGEGMGRDGLQAFFDLGNSLRRGDPDMIGEKGHGTKVYFNSRSIEVKTAQNGITLHATMDEPFRKLHNSEIPRVAVQSHVSDAETSTEIVIKGYNHNRRELFTHDRLKDYILWFTKFGSVERIFGFDDGADLKLYLKGLDRDNFESIEFGHRFPDESANIDTLFQQHLIKAPDHFCRRFVYQSNLQSFPEIKYHAVFSLEGTQVKYGYNNMLRRQRYQAPSGGYTIQERYGLWLCRDFIPIQRKNEWITTKGSEYTRFHAFFNCQKLELTANRGSVDNTPSEILQDIKNEVGRIYEEIILSDDWDNLEWLEREATGYRYVGKEQQDFEKRKKRASGVTVVN